MAKRIAVEWKEGQISGTIGVRGARIESGRLSRGSGSFAADGMRIQAEAPCRLELTLEETGGQGGNPAVVTVDTEEKPFSFFLRDVDTDYPIYIPAYGASVTAGEDGRTYAEIEEEIRGRGLLTNQQRIELEPEEDYENAARHTRDLPGQTWLGLSRDMRIFGVGFRGVGGEELLWDWVQPRFHGQEVKLPETGDQPVRYRYMLGRGIGCVDGVSRRLEEGVLPILHARIADDDIVYDTTSFVSFEASPLTGESLRGTHYLAADGYGHGHMFTPEQEKEREGLLPEEMNRNEETVLYFRAVAVNTAKVPRYAWFKNVIPNAFVLNNDSHYSFDGAKGFVKFSDDRVCCVSKLNGRPLAEEETAVLVRPGESAVFEFYLPHRPITAERAAGLASQNFGERLAECRDFWKGKLASAARVKLPERRLEEMVNAGLLHLDLVAYGLEPEGTIVPTIGVYTAIGSESAPIIQFMESAGWHDVARRSIMFFFDKQHDDGFIQNFGGYMLETGAVLWSVGEHYRYTRDEAWISEIKPKLLKAYDYILAWRKRNMDDRFIGKGYGMLEGKTADPEDPFHSFMLNGYAYIGLRRLAEVLAETDSDRAKRIAGDAEALRQDIRDGFLRAMALSPVVPLADGSWIPTAPPWVEHCGPLALYAEGGKWFTHGSSVARDSLLGPLYLAFQEVLGPDEPETGFLLNFHGELMTIRNVALSQPYYSIHPWVHLKRREVKPFLKAYYNGFTGLADRETYSFWEHFFHASPHKTHEEGWFLMQTRWMLYMEEGNTLRLLPGIPRKWLEDGKSIELDRIASYFGPVSLQVESQIGRGVIKARVSCESDRAPQEVRLRLPHPDGKLPAKVSGGVFDRTEESVLIRSFNGFAEVELIY